MLNNKIDGILFVSKSIKFIYCFLLFGNNMAPLGPLTTNRLTVRLDPERAARLEYWATDEDNAVKIKSYNQILQNALDEYLDRNTASSTEGAIPITIPGLVRDKLHDLKGKGFGSIDHLVSEAIEKYAMAKLKDEKEYQFLSNEVGTMTNRRKMIFSDYGSD
tara:strand:- start:44 stop:529 length:486 start_codon:yes stop_codon:yes gene_type:complete